MADVTAVPTFPSWLKWTLGLGVLAAAAVGGVELAQHAKQLKDPWQMKPARPRGKIEGLEFVVQQEDENDDWTVMSTLYEEVDKHGSMSNGHVGDILVYATKKEAVTKARSLGREAKKSGHFKKVRVVATRKEWKALDRQRRLQEAREG